MTEGSVRDLGINCNIKISFALEYNVLGELGNAEIRVLNHLEKMGVFFLNTDLRPPFTD